jgi:hypothetical protein
MVKSQCTLGFLMGDRISWQLVGDPRPAAMSSLISVGGGSSATIARNG